MAVQAYWVIVGCMLFCKFWCAFPHDFASVSPLVHDPIFSSVWATTWQNKQNECAPSEDSDQPGHPHSLIRVFAVRMKKAWALSYPLSAQRRLWSDWADAQADLSLHWAHTHFVGFVISWPSIVVRKKQSILGLLTRHHPQFLSINYSFCMLVKLKLISIMPLQVHIGQKNR